MNRTVPARYDVEIFHRRTGPLDYAFTFSSSTWLVDLDDIPQLPKAACRLAHFDPADHFGPESLSLRQKVDALLSEHGIAAPARVLMLASPKVFGYVFNPLSVFYCFDRAGNYRTAIAEVHNTYGQRHSYVTEVDHDGFGSVDKKLYVSPFYPVDGSYELVLPEPNESLAIDVRLYRKNRLVFSASLSGSRRRRRVGNTELWRVLATPLATRGVMAGIRRHGINLYLKGLRPFPRNPQRIESGMSRSVTNFEQQTTAGNATLDWPDVVTVPHNPVRGPVARRLVKRAFGGLAIRVQTSDGDTFGQGGDNSPQLYIERPRSFYQRIGASGLIGFGESYMAGDWRSDELAGVLTVMAQRMSTLIPPKLQRLRAAVLHARPSSQDNTVDGARDNIHRHYDLSNELFQLFLDESMTYSAALFDGDPASSGEDLMTAQHRKIDRLLDVAGVAAGSSVLEIGTGWGELAIRAALRGAQVTTVTISTEQAELASKRVVEAGLAELVDVRLQDYREVSGQFDAVVSVEMIEAVGANHWDEYFGVIERLLRPGGRAGLQAITMPHDRMLASMDTYTWIVKYIFPGGMIPSIRAVHEHSAAAGLQISSELSFGLHYAETLRRWHESFVQQATEIDALGFDQIFRRMWSLYLAYSEAGFRSRYLDVVQFGLTKAAQS